MEYFTKLSNTKKIVAVVVVAVSYVAFVALKPKRVLLFYSDNCGHCQAFKPEWALIKEKLPTAEYNCGEGDQAMCKSYGITGYPTIMVEKGFTRREYSGQRTLDNIKSFYDSV